MAPVHQLSRRRLITAGGGLVAGAAAVPAVSPAATAAPERAPGPNFLWFFAEDVNPYLSGPVSPAPRTPALDALTEGGIRFDVAYSAAPVCAPSRFAFLTGVRPESAGPAHHMRSTARMPDTIVGYAELLRGAGYYTTNNSKTDYNADIDVDATWDASNGQAHWRNRPTPQTPFCAQFTTMANHESALFDVVDGAVRPADVRVPAFLPDTPEIRAGIAHAYNVQERADAALGTRLRELEEDGLADDTIVVYCGDNGGALPWSKRFANDFGLHVPLVVRVPPRWRHLFPGEPGSVVHTPVNGVDIPVTLLTLAGVAVPAHMQGTSLLAQRRRGAYSFGQRSRMDERYDLQRTVRDDRFLLVRNYMPHRPYGQHMAYMWQQRAYQVWEHAHLDGVLTPEQDRFWGPKPFEELYDLHEDPDQVTNLVDSRRHQRYLRELQRALDAHIIEVNDNGFLPEGHPVEGYEESRRPGAYPLRDLLEVAEVAARRDAAELDRLMDWLTSDGELIRYWAAQGLLAQGLQAGDLAHRMTAAFHAESSVYVRIPLAEALARLGHTSTSVAYLAETLDGGSDRWIWLMAANALTFVGVAALPYRDVVGRAAESDDEYLRNAGRYLALVLDGEYVPESPVF